MIFGKAPYEKEALVMVAVVISSELGSSIQGSEPAVPAVVSSSAHVSVMFLQAHTHLSLYPAKQFSELQIVIVYLFIVY